MDTTYKELLATLDDAPRLNNEFIELNKYGMCTMFYGAGLQSFGYHLSEQDCSFFWGCMKIYDAYHTNYYDGYLKMVLGYFGDFSNGMGRWHHGFEASREGASRNRIDAGRYDDYCENLESLCTNLRFFGMESYGDLSLHALEQFLLDAPRELAALTEDDRWESKERYKQLVAEKQETYFNFGDFSDRKFKGYVEACTTKQKNGGDISVDEAIQLAQEAPNCMYIVTLSKNGDVIFAGKTSKLLAYLEKYSRRYEADSASFEAIDEDYVRDVLLATIFFFDLPLDTVRVNSYNRKYTTLSKACFVYKRSDGIPRKEVLAAIRAHKLRPIELPSGDIVYDKIALERALR